MAHQNKVPIGTKSINTAKVTYVKLEDIFEPVGLNGGDVDATRWDLDIPKVRKAYDTLVQSIKQNGFLIGVVAIKLPYDVVLYNIEYKKDTWLAVDVNGRIRVLKDLIENGYILNKDNNEMRGKVPVCDVTDLVIDNQTSKSVDEDIIERLWETLVKLNTGQLQWTDYDFISTGARAITNTEQKKIWNYLANEMKKYHKEDVSNKAVLGATIGSLTDVMKKNTFINYDMRFERYSHLILELIKDMREEHGSKYCKAPYLTLLANHFRKAARLGVFKGWDYNNDGEIKESTIDDYYKISGNLYDDSHFFEFKKYLEFFSTLLLNSMAPQEGFPGGTIKFNIEIHKFIMRSRNKYDRKEM
jgi:hypothetical protein